MIKENTYYFGYGDIGVCAEFFAPIMHIIGFEPPTTPGEFVKNSEVKFYPETELIIYFDSLERLNEFKNLVEKTKTTHGEFEFDGHVFNFNKYHEGTYKTFDRAFSYITGALIMPMAC